MSVAEILLIAFLVTVFALGIAGVFVFLVQAVARAGAGDAHDAAQSDTDMSQAD